MPGPVLISRVAVTSPDIMDNLGMRLAALLRGGDCIGLTGDLGAGKSTLARAMILAATSAQDIVVGDVPSPTFTLVQPYPLPSADDPGREIWHYDLWRLEDPEEVIELGIEEALMRHISLIEWPQRMGHLLPASHLMITITKGEAETHREVHFHGDEAWAERLRPVLEQQAL